MVKEFEGVTTTQPKSAGQASDQDVRYGENQE